MPFYTHNFDHFSLTVLQAIPDGFANPFSMFPGVSKSEIDSEFIKSPALFGASAEEMRFTINVFLIKIDGKSILVDTGIPVDSPDSILLQSFKESGLTLEEVDLVILTHRDGDHIGGACREAKPLYPNATYLMGSTEYLSFKSDFTRSELFLNSVGILETADRLKVIGDDEEGSPGVRLWLIPGHRKGATSVLVGDQLAIMADTWHTPLQVGNPSWCIKFDEDPTLAAETRSAAMAQLASEQRVVAVPHTTSFGIGRIEKCETGQVWEPLIPFES